MTRHSDTNRQAFTLIELLGVITIILVLAAMTLGVGNFALEKSRIAKTRARLARATNQAESKHQIEGDYYGAHDILRNEKDAWGNGYRCEVINADTGKSAGAGERARAQLYYFASNGPDEKRDTTDDIIMGNTTKKKGM